MFSTLESSWDKSARRGWSAAASFGFQAMALSLLLLIPLLTVQGPPRLPLWEAVMAPPPPPPPAPAAQQHPLHSVTNMSGEHVLQPPTIPSHIADVHETAAPAAPDLGELGVNGGTGSRGRGAANSIGDSVAIIPPPPSAPTRPPRISHWAEGNLIYRVQPVYPTLARQARIQGAVQLRAIISKEGTIEHLAVESGHPMLIGSAIEAVRQWRYRPYLLNEEPIEIETEITVNFVLSN
jgi:periplasmic protein TonB